MASYPNPTAQNLNLTSNNGFLNLINYLNDITNDWFINMFLISIGILVFMGFYKSTEDVSGGFAIAGFVVFSISLLLWAGKIISGVTFSICIGIMIVGILILLFSKKD